MAVSVLECKPDCSTVLSPCVGSHSHRLTLSHTQSAAACVCATSVCVCVCVCVCALQGPRGVCFAFYLTFTYHFTVIFSPHASQSAPSPTSRILLLLLLHPSHTRSSSTMMMHFTRHTSPVALHTPPLFILRKPSPAALPPLENAQSSHKTHAHSFPISLAAPPAPPQKGP